MAEVDFLEVADQLQMKAPDAPLPYLARCLRQATMKFCEESESYIYRFDPVTVITGEREYEVDLPRRTRVVRGHSLYYEGKRLEPTSETLLDSEMPGWDSRLAKPSRYFFRGDVLMLAPVPPVVQAGAITGSVILKPRRSATSIDEDFFDENELALYDGALEIVFSDVKEVWGDVALSSMHGALFREAIERAKSKAQQDHTPKRRVMAYGGC